MKASTSVLILVILSVAAFAEKLIEKQNSSSESLDLDNLDKLSSKEAETLLLLVKGLFNLGYSENKLDVISGIVNALNEDEENPINMTVIGTQNIYDADGSIKEIRTIELSMPNLKRKSLINFDSKNADDDDLFDTSDYEKIREQRKMMNALSMMGLNMEIAYQELDKLGNVEESVFIANNILAYQSEGLYYINKTIEVEDEDEGKDHAKQYFKPLKANLKSLLIYDKEGKFMKEKSFVQPELFASVESDDESPEAEVIHTTLKSLVNAFLESENRDAVPETLRQSLETHYPGVLFTVTEGEPDGSYMNKDFSIHLNYNMVEHEDVISYSVYGYNLTTAASS